MPRLRNDRPPVNQSLEIETASPCRLSIYLSRLSNVGVILRRGPSEWTQLISWERKTDKFTPGQWFRGRVYERRCDLSPNGRYFIYFAAKYGRARDLDGIGDAWTAISRPPYFTALSLWTNIGGWYGGGVFKTDRQVWLDATCSLQPHPKFKVKQLRIAPLPARTSPWEQRLLRDGWQLVERGVDPRTFRRVGAREVWAKVKPGTSLKLCRQMKDIDIKRFGGFYAETFWIETDRGLVPIEGASWVDWDTWKRLVFVRDGRLFTATIAGSTLQEEQLFNFNPLKPHEVIAPAWACRW